MAEQVFIPAKDVRAGSSLDEVILFSMASDTAARKLNREFMDLSNDIVGEVSATLRRFATPHKRTADKLLSRGTLWEKHLQPLLAPVMRDLPNT